jgi:putative tryptophan/tyrosine transport system substrate-binding protein
MKRTSLPLQRREFIAGLGGTLAGPLAAQAQPAERARRVGVLMNGTATGVENQAYLAAFTQGLRESGWTQGQNVHVDVRWSAGDAGLSQIYAAQLIGLAPDVILVSSSTNLTAILQATNIVPVVFIQVSDPVAQGFVQSVKRPGGNITGFGAYEFSIAGKWLELLKQIAPDLTRVAVMFNPDTSPQSKFFMRAVEAAQSALGMQTSAIQVRSTAEIEPVLAAFASQPNGALMLPTDTFMGLRYPLIVDLAMRYRLPSIGAELNFAQDGGLMGYTVNINWLGNFRQAATYVDRILRGTKPGDLPVQGPTKYSLVINLRTAKALGLSVPQTLLVAADEVIE